VTSDHGHTEVMKDDAHALSTKDGNDPPAVLEKAGYRVRPFEAEVNDSNPFQSVLAYQGAIAYVYLADRSTCAGQSTVCDWTRPPRYEADVLPAAEAFHRNNLDCTLAPGMRGALDLILTRRPVPVAENDLPFEVYIGNGKTESLDEHLRAHPHPSYIAFASRLRDLAVGPHGERAGDVLLVANNGDRERVEDRYYFATPYHSWHGSPSVQDSRIPLMVAHPKRRTAELQTIVRPFLGRDPRAQDVGALLIGLREGKAAAVTTKAPGADQTAPEAISTELKRLERDARRRLADFRSALLGHPVEARAFLASIFAGPLKFTPEGNRYRIEGEVPVATALFAGVPKSASPGGFEPPLAT
jgi:hypothetical protein